MNSSSRICAPGNMYVCNVMHVIPLDCEHHIPSVTESATRLSDNVFLLVRSAVFRAPLQHETQSTFLGCRLYIRVCPFHCD